MGGSLAAELVQCKHVMIQGFKLLDFAAKMFFEMKSRDVKRRRSSGRDADGVAFKLSDYRGKYVIVVFWGGWCHTCHKIQPLANQAAAQLKDKNGVVIGVNTDIETEAKKALADYQVGFRNVLDNTSSRPNTTLHNLPAMGSFFCGASSRRRWCLGQVGGTDVYF